MTSSTTAQPQHHHQLLTSTSAFHAYSYLISNAVWGIRQQQGNSCQQLTAHAKWDHHSGNAPSTTLTCHIGGSLKTMSTNMNPSGRMHSRQDASGTILNHAEAMRSPLCAASRCVNSMKSIWFNIEPLPELLQCDRCGEANWKGNGMLMTNMAY